MSHAAHDITEALSEYRFSTSRDRLLKTIASFETIESANQCLQRLTGVQDFFPDSDALKCFERILATKGRGADNHHPQGMGDFQTPSHLALRVCRLLVDLGVAPRIILEPTFGLGNFIEAALAHFPMADLIYGVEIQGKYEWHLKLALFARALESGRPRARIVLMKDDIFTHRFPDEVLTSENILIIGNPPWVTNAELGSINGHNLPKKRNADGLSGFDALTGKSNFDIAEYILFRMLELFSGRPGTIALLCKNSVIRDVLRILPQRSFQVSEARQYQIDAKSDFGAAVDASLLVADIGGSRRTFACQTFRLSEPKRPVGAFGWLGDKFVSSMSDYGEVRAFDGKSPLEWRQGVKHDCAPVMELERSQELLENGYGERVDVEGEAVHALLKSSDLRAFEARQPRRVVIVTQHRIGEDTSVLRVITPKLWDYLN
ncbi:MAG: hypothetical protein ACRDIY_22870, partial [Chloroflexota bacterium]